MRKSFEKAVYVARFMYVQTSDWIYLLYFIPELGRMHTGVFMLHLSTLLPMFTSLYKLVQQCQLRLCILGRVVDLYYSIIPFVRPT